MVAILASDIHLNENSRDSYRWGLFPWLKEQVKKYKAQNVILLGDYTDSKDKHSYTLVNKFINQIVDLSSVCSLYLLAGNHDGLIPSSPFFEFINTFEDEHLKFFTKPSEDSVYRIGPDAIHSKALFLPHTKDYEEWLPYLEEDKYGYVFTHATFQGCLSENGTKLNGFPTDIFKKLKSAKLWAGDIHVPQSIGPVEYVGAPYRTRFGDDFDPRCVLIDNQGKAKDIRFPCPSKELVVISNMRDLEKQTRNFNKEDYVKVRVKLMRSEYTDWPKLKKDIAAFMSKNEFKLVGPELVSLSAPKRDDGESVEKNTGIIDPKQVVAEYAKAQRADKRLAKIGLELLEEIK